FQRFFQVEDDVTFPRIQTLIGQALISRHLTPKELQNLELILCNKPYSLNDARQKLIEAGFTQQNSEFGKIEADVLLGTGFFTDCYKLSNRTHR
ncbi:MAG: hypothetical protein HYS98_01830, partial [Deltaproteobacteria bacterium]|nr:hypothetical protein [Deltaproteobacteria bacterium]